VVYKTIKGFPISVEGDMQTKWEISFPVGVPGINLWGMDNINHT